MNEKCDNLTSACDPAPETAREVVLRYEAPAIEPVVERYVHPDPLPVRRAAEPERKRSRRGLRIFLICMALLLALPVGKLMLSRRAHQTTGDGDDLTDRYTVQPESGQNGGRKTTIPHCPGNSDVRLRVSETHGEALSLGEIYDRVNPSTVMVVTAVSDTTAVLGTGVIFTSDGYILTNAHLVRGGQQAYIILSDGTIFRGARLSGYDDDNDLAVLKIEAQGLPVAEFGDSDALRVGDPVCAIGNPLSLELRGTLTDGIVSAITREYTMDGRDMKLIQTNTALNNGNSGGPLINAYGQVVGINTMKMNPERYHGAEGIGFAIPISTAAWMVDDLIAYGELRGEAVMGIMVGNVALSTGERKVVIGEVTEGSAGDRAGLQVGDAIVSADGDAVETTDDLLRIRRRYRVGDTMDIEIDRGGERMIVGITLQAAKTGS